jgi:hypothetical protein
MHDGFDEVLVAGLPTVAVLVAGLLTVAMAVGLRVLGPLWNPSGILGLGFKYSPAITTAINRIRNSQTCFMESLYTGIF